jgi:hypothetical protein
MASQREAKAKKLTAGEAATGKAAKAESVKRIPAEYLDLCDGLKKRLASMLDDAETKEHVLQAYKTCFSTLMRKLDEYDEKLRAAAKESASCPAQVNNRPDQDRRGADRLQPFDAARADRVDTAVPVFRTGGRGRRTARGNPDHPKPGPGQSQHGRGADQPGPDDDRIGPGCRPCGGKRCSHHCALH